MFTLAGGGISFFVRLSPRPTAPLLLYTSYSYRHQLPESQISITGMLNDDNAASDSDSVGCPFIPVPGLPPTASLLESAGIVRL